MVLRLADASRSAEPTSGRRTIESECERAMRVLKRGGTNLAEGEEREGVRLCMHFVSEVTNVKGELQY